MKDDEYIRRLPPETQDEVIARVTKEQQQRAEQRMRSNLGLCAFPLEVGKHYWVHLNDQTQFEGDCARIGNVWAVLTNVRFRFCDAIIPAVTVSLESIVLTYEVER